MLAAEPSLSPPPPIDFTLRYFTTVSLRIAGRDSSDPSASSLAVGCNDALMLRLYHLVYVVEFYVCGVAVRSVD